MNATAHPELVERTRRALAAHGRAAEVLPDADGGLIVRRELDQARVRRLLQDAALPVAARAAIRSDRSGGA